MPQPSPQIIPGFDFMVPAQGDAAAMSAVHCLCFSSGWSEDALTQLFATPGIFAAGLRRNEAPGSGGPDLAGFILFRLAAGEAEILTLAVSPDYRQRGLARALLEHSLVMASAHGAASMVLEVSQDNQAARALYEAAAFREVGRRKGYYRSEGGADALILRCPLSRPAP